LFSPLLGHQVATAAAAASPLLLLQDYIGSYLPAGDGSFTFNKGPLLRCARLGHWLLLDELNLADPAVLSALCAVLEGASTLAVPGTQLAGS
jgi:midasin